MLKRLAEETRVGDDNCVAGQVRYSLSLRHKQAWELDFG